MALRTTSLAVSSPFPKASSWNFCFFIKHFLCCFTPHFQLKSLLLNPHKPILGNVIFSVYFFSPFQWAYFKGWKNRRSHFCNTSLQVSVYAESLLPNVFSIWMKKLLLLSDSSVFSLMPSICNVKCSISLWKVFNLFLPFILVLHFIISRSWLSTVNYFLFFLSSWNIVNPFTNKFIEGEILVLHWVLLVF